MKEVAAILFLTGSLAANASESFDDRVQRARALEETPLGSAYQDSMWPLLRPFIASLVKSCVPDDVNADLTSFVWVGTVTLEGKLSANEVQPETPLSECFARGMEQAPFPKPPEAVAREGMPVTFNMRLHRTPD
jgi:hypothetical protein